ncbi:MAG TPA: sugar ABC transporter permease [Firmicutes bacterium]|nr:sugar ABC transporter permease [Bacillota bacterium]
MKSKSIIRASFGDKVFNIFNIVLMCLLVGIVIYPIYFIIIASVSSPEAVNNGEVWLFPNQIDLGGYQRILSEKLIWTGYKNTIIYTLLGTFLNICFTIPAGYALSRKDLPYRKAIMAFLIVTMFFGGGLVPFYTLVSNLGMVNTMWALIIPKLVSVWNIFMTKSYYESLSAEGIEEAAKMDGANDFTTFFKIILPISKPIISVMVLFYAVGHWNSYFDAMIFISDENLYPLQLVLRDILIVADQSTGGMANVDSIVERLTLANQIKYGAIIVSSLPLIIFYPFIQRFFKEGIMVGSLK